MALKQAVNRGLALTFTPDPGTKQANIQIDGQGWVQLAFPGPRRPKDGLRPNRSLSDHLPWTAGYLGIPLEPTNVATVS